MNGICPRLWWSIILTHYLVLSHTIRDMANVLTLLSRSSPSTVSSVMFIAKNCNFFDRLYHARLDLNGMRLSLLRHVYYYVCMWWRIDPSGFYKGLIQVEFMLAYVVEIDVSKSFSSTRTYSITVQRCPQLLTSNIIKNKKGKWKWKTTRTSVHNGY